MALRRAGARLSTALASSPSLRLLEGRAALIQPHELRPKGIIDQLTNSNRETSKCHRVDIQIEPTKQ